MTQPLCVIVAQVLLNEHQQHSTGTQNKTCIHVHAWTPDNYPKREIIHMHSQRMEIHPALHLPGIDVSSLYRLVPMSRIFHAKHLSYTEVSRDIEFNRPRSQHQTSASFMSPDCSSSHGTRSLALMPMFLTLACYCVLTDQTIGPTLRDSCALEQVHRHTSASQPMQIGAL